MKENERLIAVLFIEDENTESIVWGGIFPISDLDNLNLRTGEHPSTCSQYQW